MKETVYCPNDECGYHIKSDKELDEQTDACGNIVCPNCFGKLKADITAVTEGKMSVKWS